MKFKNILKTAALTAGLAMSFTASAEFKDFTVDETFAGGGEVTADKLNGGYTELVTFDGLGGFVANAFATFTGFFENEGNDFVAGTEIGSGYLLYATFSAAGNVGPGPIGSIAALTGTSGSFTLWLDNNADTSADGTLALSNTGDDVELASSSSLGPNVGLVYSFGGVFDFLFTDFSLTTDGEAYFVAPDPFWMRVTVDGDFDEFPLTGTQRLSGDVSAVFVPEPSTLAVFALGLIGLAASGRRRIK